MSEHNSVGFDPAFPDPQKSHCDFGHPCAYPGITILDYFAAKAMQVIFLEADDEVTFTDMADSAYIIAEAMVAEKQKREAK
jgi:hypothetical protein